MSSTLTIQGTAYKNHRVKRKKKKKKKKRTGEIRTDCGLDRRINHQGGNQIGIFSNVIQENGQTDDGGSDNCNANVH
jgi:hypothetical protein